MRIIPPEPRHRADWDRLFAGYAAFYKVEQTQAMRDTVWAWLMDPAHELKALVAEDAAGRAIGLAHYTPMVRPSRATYGGFLNDLFVDPAQRGGGVADALLAALSELGRQKGWNVIRWITADDNYRARGVYDRVATRTMWVTYDIAL
ncbi:GNAT family N-acetyltransferase [Roseococcus sp. DSY-14]|uniref:GNAT family N-acetyltransferase n=1 Tax=Roseococcus sp. DSY-14 TaxID=3369650 RepID=UPI00387AFD48